MKIKDLLELCADDFCSVSVYDNSTNKEKYFSHPQEAISEYGYFSVISWVIDKNIGGCVFKIKTRTEF